MELFDGNPAKSVFEPLDVSVVMRGRCENLWQCRGATRLGSTLRRGRRSMGVYSHPAVVQVTSVHQQAQVKAPCTHDRREADPDGFTLREALIRQRRDVAGQVPRSRSGDALRHGAARRFWKRASRFGAKFGFGRRALSGTSREISFFGTTGLTSGFTAIRYSVVACACHTVC